jgi:hypothetical protein
MPATVTAKYLGDENIEKQIRERLRRELNDCHDTCRVSVLGSAGSDLWEIKVALGPDGQRVKKLDGHQTVDKIAEEVAHMVQAISRNF